MLDYSVRNAGDLDAGQDIYETYLAEGQTLCQRLHCPVAGKLFVMTPEDDDIEAQFLAMFDAACREVRKL